MTRSARSVSKNVVSTLILLVVLGAAIAIPCIWRFVVPTYKVSSYVRVAPATQDLLSGKPGRIMLDYERFVKTQAMMVNGKDITEAVLDDLADRGLKVFKQGDLSSSSTFSLLDFLNQSASDGTFQAEPVPDTEFIDVSMTSPIPEQAQVIVDAYVRNYLARVAFNAIQADNESLVKLEGKKGELLTNLSKKKQVIRSIAEEYGSTQLDGHQQMMGERATRIWAQLAQLEASRLRLEAQIRVMERGVDPNVGAEIGLNDLNEFISRDPLIQELTKRMVDLQIEVVIANLQIAPGNPVIEEKEVLLKTFERKIEQRQKDLKRDCNRLGTDRADYRSKEALMAARVELEQLKAYEARLRAEVEDQDDHTVRVGNTNLDLQDIQFEIKLDTEELDAINRRIRQIEMETEQNPRITQESKAAVQSYHDPRWKYTWMTLLGALGVLTILSVIRGLLGRPCYAARCL
jgi:hypothetical protein